jgi:hypothetical protein
MASSGAGARTWQYWRPVGTQDTTRLNKEMEKLPEHGQVALKDVIGRWKRHQEVRGEVRKLTDRKGLLELRTRVGNDQFRAVFFLVKPHIAVCVSVFYHDQSNERAKLDTCEQRKRVWAEEGARRRAVAAAEAASKAPHSGPRR